MLTNLPTTAVIGPVPPSRSYSEGNGASAAHTGDEINSKETVSIVLMAQESCFMKGAPF
jgi:hypothetical protein